MVDLRSMSDESLAAPGAAALYGDALAAERARRRGVVNLRVEDAPPPDPWDAERARAGHSFDPVAFAGMRAGSRGYGDAFEREAARREQERRRQTQCSQYAVAMGATVTLRDGTQLGEGAALTRELVGHHASEILHRLLALGCVIEIQPHEAFLNGLDISVGPYVVVADALQVGARLLRRGQGVSEADFPSLPLVRRITEETPLSELTVRELLRLIGEQIDLRVPRRSFVPPPLSEFESALSRGAIERAPNFNPKASK
jgi:hypothetical protein